MTRMAESTIRLLGPPSIESTGTPSRQPRGRKAWAVLAYLALQPDGTGRSRLATLLFPDAADPLGALRWNLSELRRTLAGVMFDGDPLRLALQPPWRCDVVELVGLGTLPRPDPRSLNGQLLEGLSFADCPVFDSWLADQRYRLENCAQSLLYESSVSALASGDPREAAELASRALQRDPFHTDCNAVLVKALVATGEHRHARESQIVPIVAHADELGLPLPLTRRLVELIHALEQGRAAPDWAHLDDLETLRRTSS